ncbi:hypothetical protein [Rhizobium sp. BK418]|uniref:hypothetical protein n=1 Tax=Rhizobium sp. BK418 TaxID=2512120 RepID=UPI0010D9E377|nr:hypothetical protein [Rhizobium sp. BK418]TCS05371.1 hypothetical protein EV281_1031054 [Rhizobium sp. BK418]
MGFNPAVVTAHPGDAIVWRNKDMIDHTATSKGNFDVVIPAGKPGSTAVKGDWGGGFYLPLSSEYEGADRGGAVN